MISIFISPQRSQRNSFKATNEKKSQQISLWGSDFILEFHGLFLPLFCFFCWGLGGRLFPPIKSRGFVTLTVTRATFLRVTKFAAGPWVGVELDPRNPLERRGVGNVTVVPFFSEGLIRTTDATSQRWGEKGGMYILYVLMSKNVRSAEIF